jgi:hypothetical protein
LFPFLLYHNKDKFSSQRTQLNLPDLMYPIGSE